MGRRASTAAATAVIVGTWLACGPLTNTREQANRAPAPGLDAATEGSGSGGLPDAPADAATEGSGSGGLPDAPADAATEGSGSGLADAPVDIATEGGGPDAAPDATIDAPPPPPPDAAPDAPVPPDDGAGIIDAPGSGSGKRDAGGPGGVTSTNLEETSVYRCQSSRGPIGAWPILGAIGFIIYRRRRGPSSPR